MSGSPIHFTFTTALPGRPSAISCALRRIAFPLNCRTSPDLTKVLEQLEKRRES